MPGLMAERPFPRAPSHGQRGGAGRRRHKGAPRRDQPAHDGVLFLDELPEYDRGGAGGTSTAARRRLCQRRPCQRAGEIPCAGDARRGDEPVPLRQLWQRDTVLPLHTEGNRALSGGASPDRCLTESICSWRSPLCPCARSPRARRKSRRPTFISACRLRGSASRSDTRAKASPATRSFPRASWKRFARWTTHAASCSAKPATPITFPCARSAACARSRGPIADLAGAEEIGRAHLLEALRYRNLEGNYWK